MSIATPAEPIAQADAEPVDFLYARDNGLLLTTEEYDAIDDTEEGYRYELIRGVLVVSPAPSSEERIIQMELGRQVLNYRDGSPQGHCLRLALHEHELLIGSDRRRADMVIWLNQPGKFHAKTSTPQIVIEIVSPGGRNRRRDFIDKRDAYLGLDIQEYWILDRVRRTMTVFAKRNGVVGERNLTSAEVYATDLMPGFELRLGPLFGIVDRLQSEG
jgi:Uma2 family endonuclease